MPKETPSRVEDAIAIGIERLTRTAGRLYGIGGVGPYVHVENLVSGARGEAAPRVVIIGVQFGRAR